MPDCGCVLVSSGFLLAGSMALVWCCVTGVGESFGLSGLSGLSYLCQKDAPVLPREFLCASCSKKR